MDDVRFSISIIMSTFNRKDYLQTSIESVLNQTFTDFEFILVNNGSTDGSDKICGKYAKKDNRIKLINIDTNQGVSGGRNRGLDEASSEYIAFVDDDDYCEKEMFSFLWELVRKVDADIGICGSWYDYNGSKIEKYIFEEELILNKEKGLDELLKREKYNVSPATKLYRKKLFDGLRFPKDVIVDDIHVIYKVFSKAEIIIAKGKPLYSFRKHVGNVTNFIQTNKFSAELLNEYLEMYRERTEYLCKEVPEIKERAIYSEWSFMISMCDKILKYKCVGCEEQYNYMVEKLGNNFEEIINCSLTTDKEKELIRIFTDSKK